MDKRESEFAEDTLNGEPIDWNYWASMGNFTHVEAARLAYCIDPIKWPGTECAQGPFKEHVHHQIARLERWLESHSQSWTLVKLVDFLGKNFAPAGMVRAIEDNHQQAEKCQGMFISYPRTKALLAQHLNASEEEIAQWISIGSENGGLDAYVDIHRQEDAHRFSFEHPKFYKDCDYITPLINLHFKNADIERFQPTTRFITGKALLKRWTGLYGHEGQAKENIVRRLIARHPIAGAPENSWDENETASILSALFDLSQIREIEEQDGLDIGDLSVSPAIEKNVVEWVETLHNGKPIDWDYWKRLSNITSKQAAKLVHLIDPTLWPDDKYAAGKEYYTGYKGEQIDWDLSVKLQKLEQLLENHSSKWNLADLVKFLGEGAAPYGLLQTVKELTEAETEQQNKAERPVQQTEPVENGSNEVETMPDKIERTYTQWLRKIWISEGRLTGGPFFTALKKYKDKNESLVIDWWNTSREGPGVKLKTDTGEIVLARRQIQKIVSKFIREEKEEKSLSSNN
jgi:hypothetical protein